MNYQQKKDSIWNKGTKVKGMNSKLYRKDDYGNIMFYPSYGKDSKLGWSIDHIKPQSRGGSDQLNNLRPLNSSANKSRGNNYN